MTSVDIDARGRVSRDEVVELYKANGWSSANKPDQLLAGLRGSETLVTARQGGRLVGLGNAISDGHLVVYYPHLLVHPSFQGQGIGRRILAALQERYADFHQQMITSDVDAVRFYRSMGFERAGETVSLWIYAGDDH